MAAQEVHPFDIGDQHPSKGLETMNHIAEIAHLETNAKLR